MTPPDDPEAARHASARTARAGALTEDYVEIIADLLEAGGEARLTDIARRLGVTHATATKTIARLKRDGLAHAKPYRGVFLTEAGVAMAHRVRARHQTVVAFLRAIGVPPAVAEVDAEGIEHYVSDETLSAFERLIAKGTG
jgi:DtxR family manganese transport transcriptional regulator